MVIVPIHQASSLVPQLSTTIVDLSPPKPVSPPIQEPIITATTATTTLLPPPPPLPQSTTNSELATRVSALEKRSADFEQKNKLRDKTTQALASRVYKPENNDLYSKIDKQVNEVVKEAIHNAVQAPLRFRSPQLRRHLTQEAPSSSSKQKPASSSEQPVNDDPIPDDMRLSESEDTGAAHLLKIKTRPEWLKPIPEEETPETPKPYWVIPPNNLPETENNWADAMAKTYKDPKENKLLRKTGDMASFIQWYCKQIRKKKLIKADFEGQAYKIARPFHKNNISLQIQMEKCHLLLIDHIDLINPEDLEYLVSSNKERRHALSISKLKAAYYPDFGLKELVPSLWTKSMISVQPMVFRTGGSSARNSTLQDTMPLLIAMQLDHT
ncbi:hypothetical protein Tco_0461474 [Tanacetum coccineum]